MPFGNIIGSAFLLAILDWIAVLLAWKRVEYFTKPSVILLLLTWLILAGSQNPHLWWFAAALVFSLGGDILLLLSNKFFLVGLFSFVLAHLAYVLGLNPTFPPLNLASLVLFLVVGLTEVQMYRFFFARLEAPEKTDFQKPAIIYLIAIGLMVFSALVTMVRPEMEWGIFPAILASAGALLFYSSDTLLAWNKFIHPTRANRMTTIITYHLAQFALIIAAVTNYSY